MQFKRPKIGDVVVFTDTRGGDHSALVTAVHSEKCINVVRMSGEPDRTDDYGRQIERETSMNHVSMHGAHGFYWRWPGEKAWSPSE